MPFIREVDRAEIYVGADTEVFYEAARKRSDGTYLNSGTCTWALHEDSAHRIGGAIAGASGAVDYVGSSSGNYLGVIDAAVTGLLTVGSYYWLRIVFTHPVSGCDDERRFPLVARHRTSN
jgi:hypothetical protein